VRFSPLISYKEAAGEYGGTNCRVIEMYFSADPASKSGPSHVLLYVNANRWPIARLSEQWSTNGQMLIEKRVREYTYDIALDDNLFIFSPPPGAHMRNQ
jgi:outer membrane lipoprotein-sorting protein